MFSLCVVVEEQSVVPTNSSPEVPRTLQNTPNPPQRKSLDLWSVEALRLVTTRHWHTGRHCRWDMYLGADNMVSGAHERTGWPNFDSRLQRHNLSIYQEQQRCLSQKHKINKKRQDNSVSIVTRLWYGPPSNCDSIPGRENRVFLPQEPSNWPWDPHRVLGTLSPGIRRPGREVEHLPPSISHTSSCCSQGQRPLLRLQARNRP